MELKINMGGATSTSVPVGGLTMTWYMEFVAPTLVTVLVRVVQFRRCGTVMEGKFTSSIENDSGHFTVVPANRDIAERS